MKKFAFAMACTVAVVGFVLADEFAASVTKIDGSKITYFKYEGEKKDKKKADKSMTADVSKDVKVVKGKFDADAKKVVAGDPLEGGLKADQFTNIDAEKGVNVTLTTDDKGVVTQILAGFGGGGKAAAGKAGKAAAGKAGKKGKAAL